MINLTAYLSGLSSAKTAEELEDAVRADFKHPFSGPTWSRIYKVRIEAGNRICVAHPHGHYVPRFEGGRSRKLTICGQTYSVGRGGNSTGVRYAWHYAGDWAKGLLIENGFSVRAAYRIWESWGDYPHRALAIVEDALAGKISDPALGVLIKHDPIPGYAGSPINYSLESNEADKYDRRAHRPCDCGGTLFDWGSGHSEGFEFINWRCNACPDVFTEYMTQKQFYALRQRRVPA